MGLFVMNTESEPTVKGLVRSALANLDLYSDYCSVMDSDGNVQGSYKDKYGQPPPDYLVTSFAIKQLKQALQILENAE